MDKREQLNQILEATANLQHQSSSIYKNYINTKAIFQNIINQEMNKIYERKLDPKEIIEDSNLKVFQMNLSIDLDYQVYHELMIYPSIANHPSLVEENEDEMSKAMSKSRYSFYQVVERKEKDGITVLYDEYSKETIEIVDDHLGLYYKPTSYMMLRIIDYKGCKFQSGLIIELPDHSKSRSFIRKNKTLFTREYQGKALLETFTYYKTMQVNSIKS